MAVSDKVRAMLSLAGKKQVELAEHFGVSKQSMQNKLTRDSWSVADLARAAEFCGYTVALLGEDGQKILIQPERDSAEE